MSNGTNDNTILLDLNKVDFESDISGNEIWQKEAVNEFTRFLSRTAQQAKKREDERKTGDSTIIHDAIFIGGARGTGKTVFLQNIEGFWDNSFEKEETKLKLHFCKSIDPTLLVNHDNFTNVVIAHLYNEVESHIDEKCSDNSQSDGFYQALKNVCQALGKQENLGEGISGLDRVIKYRSGIQVIQLFETFLRRCINLLGVTSIVLPIDDIDMALERSHDILDVVRRMLASHLIIPVITGDLKLYEPIITYRFMQGDSKTNQLQIPMLTEYPAKDLTQAYLTKVLPHHNRISLEPIKRLLPDLKILSIGKVISTNPNIDESEDYAQFTKKLTTTLFGPLNGEERSCDWPEPTSAREATQFIRDLSPENLINLNRSELWKRYKLWAELKQDDIAYSTAISCQQIIDLRGVENNHVTLNKLHSFNPMQQKDDITPKWSGKLFFEEQVNTHKLEQNKLGKEMAVYLNELKEVKIYRSMPPIEIFNRELAITSKEVGTVLDNPDSQSNARILLDLFTFKNYYELTLRTMRQVFFSRAFDVLASSLFNHQQLAENVTSEDGLTKARDSRIKFWQRLLIDIFKDAPFYSIPAIFPTKAFNVAEDKGDEGDENLKNSQFDESTITRLAEKIAQWEHDYADAVNHYSHESLQALLFAVFNKSFTQFKLLRQVIETSQFKKENQSQESLSDLALRFKYITLNAFATFMKPAPVVLQNVAFTSNSGLIRDFDSHKNVSPPIRDNIGYFFEFSVAKEGNSATPETGKEKSDTDSNKTKKHNPFNTLKKFHSEDSHKANLLQAIANHPIFMLLEADEMKQGLFLLRGNSGASDAKKINLTKDKPIPLTDQQQATLFEGLTSENISSMSMVEAENKFNEINEECIKLTNNSIRTKIKPNNAYFELLTLLMSKFNANS